MWSLSEHIKMLQLEPSAGTASVCVTVERAEPGVVLIRPHTSHGLIWCVWCVCVCHFRGLKPDAPPWLRSVAPHASSHCCGWRGSCEHTNAAVATCEGEKKKEWSECRMSEGGLSEEEGEEHWKVKRKRDPCPGSRLLLRFFSFLGYEADFLLDCSTSMWLLTSDLTAGHEKILQDNKVSLEAESSCSNLSWVFVRRTVLRGLCSQQLHAKNLPGNRLLKQMKSRQIKPQSVEDCLYTINLQKTSWKLLRKIQLH